MYFLYVLTSVFEYIFAKKIYRKHINPISVYIIIWNVVTMLYMTRLVYLYEVTVYSWILVILFQFVYCMGVSFGNNTLIKRRYHKTVEKDSLRRIILFLCIVGALAIIPNFTNFVRTYSLNFISNINTIYHNRLKGVRGYEVIPYLGCFAYLGVTAAGVYFRRFGFSPIILMPILLGVLDALPSGGRGNLALIMLFFIIPSLFFGTHDSLREIKIHGKTKIIIGIIVSMLLFVFIRVSNVRSRWVKENPYMSPMMKKLVGISPTFYKTYTYLVNPFVSLSEYLKKPTYLFGINTFGMFRNILNKLGMHLAYQRYQDELPTPLSCNVATYIREVIQDFTIPGALVATFIFAACLGISYKIVKDYEGLEAELVCTILSVVAIMSFFVFFFRESMIWIMLFFIPFLKYVGAISIGFYKKT